MFIFCFVLFVCNLKKTRCFRFSWQTSIYLTHNHFLHSGIHLNHLLSGRLTFIKPLVFRTASRIFKTQMWKGRGRSTSFRKNYWCRTMISSSSFFYKNKTFSSVFILLNTTRQKLILFCPKRVCPKATRADLSFAPYGYTQ